MTTVSGIFFDPLNPDARAVSFLDVAWALAHQCRYAGHVRSFYCPTPEQRILTADLRWIPAGDLKVGDELLGFDEHPVEMGAAGKRRRRYRYSRVTNAKPLMRQIVRLEMSDGSTVRTSEEHPWLVATKQSRNQTWLTAGQLAKDVLEGRRRYLHRFIDTWVTDTSWQAGWLAGMYDGEGYISIQNRKGVQMGLAQRPGLVLDAAVSALKTFGVNNLYSSQTGQRESNVITLHVQGGWREMARILGIVRPMRLIEKFRRALIDNEFGKQMDGKGAPLEIIKAHFEGEGEVAGLSTTTRTYLCEGYGAHNSVAEHCWHVSRLLPPRLALAGLTHDASESVLSDVVRPAKVHMSDYLRIERPIEAAMSKAFGVEYPFNPEVYQADMAVFYAEQVTLRKQRHDVPLDAHIPAIKFGCWSPRMARYKWVERFIELTDPGLPRLHRKWLAWRLTAKPGLPQKIG